MIEISAEDLVANALIELTERSSKREVLFSEAYRYGEEIVRILSEKGKKSVLSLHRNCMLELLDKYSFLFILFSNGEEMGIRLKDNVSVRDLWDRFRGYLPIDIMQVFMDDRAVQKLIS